ncbi:MAG: Gfo/Idh/MocA family oxidoreductase [Lachnospiraceae bacterium]|nr:Gfo/Idh/MocA family oxidoreductase [Lachnospiraceae bacterium]
MKQVTAILLGAGQRGADAYASYALDYPNELKFVGVAEPREDRRREFMQLHEIGEADAVDSWEKLLERPKMADCVLICTQDQMHYEAIKKAVEKGYHILCEKPISPVQSELEEIGRIAADYKPAFSICHVLRYSPFFREIRRLLEEGVIGELVDIQHIESVGYWHMAHSFVRGNWRNRELSSPMILQKCCHDMDILLWLAGSSCVRLSSFGGLRHFKKENAPKDAPANCLDGCSYRETCPYFAPRFYLEDMEEKGGTFARVVSMKQDKASLLQALQEGPYGRCVYHCDNDVVDHQVVNLEFENGVTASLTMCAFTAKCERVINLMGTRGQMRGNMEENRIEYEDFASGRKVVIDVKVPKGGHSGSDVSMMKDFVDLVATGGTRESVSACQESIESHLMALAAEKSRLHGGRVCEMHE